MFARILEFDVKMEKKQEFIKIVKNEVLPILRKQPGFLELLPFFSEKYEEKKVINISIWDVKQNAERYERETFPKIQEIVKPFLTTPVVVKNYVLESTLCEHFEKAVAA
jgi:quinol monooxygenase YgiN